MARECRPYKNATVVNSRASKEGASKMIEQDDRPPLWVGHVVLETDRLADSEQFMRQLGMRSIVKRNEVAVLELRGGTHLVLIAKPNIVARDAPFDLMVEDLEATHKQFLDAGLAPTPIERVSPDHRGFKVREPAGHTITFYSNHVVGPV
jgi:glyoxalase/bleomycin resistance protein/dioxygenase superfamily protein